VGERRASGVRKGVARGQQNRSRGDLDLRRDSGFREGVARGQQTGQEVAWSSGSPPAG
jgi:hypothetical protein